MKPSHCMHARAAASLLRPQRSALILVGLSLAVAATTLALEAARMRLPREFATTAVRLPAEGYGGLNLGRFTAGELAGDFVRIESRFAVFDPLYATNRGKSSFTLAGPGIDPPIEGQCRFKERVVTAGVVTFDAKKLAYVCEISDLAGNAVGSLTLGEPKPSGFKARLVARAERVGAADIGDLRIDVASVHEFERSKLTSQTPLGYLLSLGADVVGAVELTGSDPTFLLRPDLTADARRAALIAALALSVLRDPANSALAD
jgi:hypothetical protein